MLRFQINPDIVFMEILTASIETMIDEIKDLLQYTENKEEEEKEELQRLLPNASKVFNARTALDTLKRMLACNKNPKLYYLNDYHYLLLYDTLRDFCVLQNDFVQEAKTIKEKRVRSQIGQFYIAELDFNGMIDTYFIDTDFLIKPDIIFKLGLEGREQFRFNKEVFAITQGLSPHPEELYFKIHNGDQVITKESPLLFNPKSKVYPDFNI